ncbi:MAG: FliA/WhiG family RNA polymerase sigma factor [Elusimicrobia bacterium]|nr:FliA/WhiG family RNA polymerase sigma factor [Elusimicrobiota bacterium]MBP9698487.1 FliA/WhiG family RNA polymerase sigma factor [Elusimicrobiota bacterium]
MTPPTRKNGAAAMGFASLVPSDVQTLWTRYAQGRDPAVREEILSLHAPLVRYIVGRMKAVLVPQADRDDLESAGALGLIKAFDRYDPSRNVKFDTFAYRWIQGSVLDHLRGLDPLGRGARRRVETYRRFQNALREELGREPSQEELRTAMGLSPEAMRDLCWEVSHATSISLDAVDMASDGPHDLALASSMEDGGPHALDRLEKQETIHQMKSALEALPEKERLVLGLYYTEELTFREIGTALGVTESRACQIHTRAVATVKEILGVAPKSPVVQVEGDV